MNTGSFSRTMYSGDEVVNMGFFDNARGKLAVREGASMKMQALWRSLPEGKKMQLRRILPDSDRDGVPDKFDCKPFNARRQDTPGQPCKGCGRTDPPSGFEYQNERGAWCWDCEMRRRDRQQDWADQDAREGDG